MVPVRDQTTIGLVSAFRACMTQEALVCIEEDELTGQDDWDEDQEDAQVRCWLGVFARQEKT
jgi:hypothetical protein